LHLFRRETTTWMSQALGACALYIAALAPLGDRQASAQTSLAAQTVVATGNSPPSSMFDGLFATVALSSRFPDGKAWADAQPVDAPAVIMEDYRRLSPQDDDALRQFVDTHFALTGMASASTPPVGLPMREHIESLWPILTRESVTPPPYSSLLRLPHPYVVPGGRFTEIYYWDSYFIMLVFGPRQADVQRQMVDNFAYLIRTYGHIPNGNRTYYLSRSQPPLFFKMVELTDPLHPRRAFARYLPELRAEHRWWMSGEARATIQHPAGHTVRLPDGSILNRYWDNRDVPRDESYRADTVAAAGTADRRVIFRNVRSAAESGWDFSSRWFADGAHLRTIRTTEIIPPDLNSILYGLEQAIADGCAETRDRVCASEFSRRAAARAKAMRAYLWNGRTGLFDDYSWRDRRLVGNISAAALYPLFFRIATASEANRVADTVEHQLLKAGGLVTTNLTTGQQWDSPNGWAPLQWISVNGLRNYGKSRLAELIARRWLGTVSKVYGQTGKLLEKYDVVTPRPGGGGEYQLQDGFGWTNGTTVALMNLYPDALTAAQSVAPPARQN